MTTLSQIMDVLRSEPDFGGVFLYNQLKDIHPHKLHNKAIVINYVTDEESRDGKMGHWVVLSNTNQIKGDDNWHGLYFFDPYGIPMDEARDIMGLPNTHEIQKLVRKLNVSWKENDTDWQVLQPHDALCGVYSCAFVVNPNYKTNPIFNTHANRVVEDKKLSKIFEKLGFVDKLD